ncbi:hypothetical protein [Spirosoma fluminis]
MTKLLLFSFALILTSCATYQARVSNREDPFTGARTRVMTVTESDNSILLRELAAYSSTGVYRPTRPSVDINHILTMIVSTADTTLTYIRVLPEKAYDVPVESQLMIRFYDRKRTEGGVLSLPLVRAYHTIGGSLIVAARVDKQALTALRSGVADIIRVERVSTNESDYLSNDWPTVLEYAREFRKGVEMLFPDDEPTPPVRRRR